MESFWPAGEVPAVRRRDGLLSPGRIPLPATYRIGRPAIRIAWRKNEEETSRTRKRAHSLGGRAARLCGTVRAAGASDECREGRPDGGLRHLRLELSRLVLREHPLPPLGALSGRRSEATKAGSHDDLRAHSGYVHPLLLARAGRRLACRVARRNLGPCPLRYPAQALLDGRPALAVCSTLPGNGLGGRDRGPRTLPSGAGRRDSVGLGRGPALYCGSAYLHSETPQPDARNIRVPRAVAPLRRGRKRLRFLGSAALPRAACLKARADCRPTRYLAHRTRAGANGGCYKRPSPREPPP